MTTPATSHAPASTFVPPQIDGSKWSALEPYYAQLIGRTLHDAASLERLLLDRSELDAAADGADVDPADADAARTRALAVRHLVERQCIQVVDLFGRTLGPRPLAFDAEAIRRLQELQLYIRQVHPGDDAEELGGDPSWLEPTTSPSGW